VNTGSPILPDVSPDSPLADGKESLIACFTVFAASSTCSLASAKFFFTVVVLGNASRTVFTASLT